VAVPLLYPPIAGQEITTLYLYYGVTIAVLPWLAGAIASTRLTPIQRLVVTFVLALHGYGLLLGIYWAFPAWDVVTHLASGALLAAGIYAMLIAWARSSNRSQGVWLHVAALVVLIACGLVWEVYEVVAPWQTVYPTGDALKDLVVDVVSWSVLAVFHSRLLGDVPEDLTRRLEGLRRRLAALDPAA